MRTGTEPMRRIRTWRQDSRQRGQLRRRGKGSLVSPRARLSSGSPDFQDCPSNQADSVFRCCPLKAECSCAGLVWPPWRQAHVYTVEEIAQRGQVASLRPQSWTGQTEGLLCVCLEAGFFAGTSREELGRSLRTPHHPGCWRVRLVSSPQQWAPVDQAGPAGRPPLPLTAARR